MKDNVWHRIMKLFLYWSFLGIITTFHGTFFIVITIVLGFIIIGLTIKQLFLKRKN
ncbi:hypothetical protein IX307_002038 [Bacteroides pyogenes]|uniref:Uncharacterized protein n=1 Tax=Bacteroides pyogenes F0041 TaxID=1321819 RepID=U2CQD9_9BACE|nr:hypothetical protein HMPREF1981_00982 [Bacteroides pyogenes F0041]MBR8706676.1 hypothetical protein [Bacteroides pyogenes]MBR8709293.1 hypothetical protein [Bacteroides pyogenes]MBR8718869.1 hypothetical protein [Bacteroides pyogenes]MBR8720864.1 hypothetical protein [Bacteroides pyogenes]